MGHDGAKILSSFQIGAFTPTRRILEEQNIVRTTWSAMHRDRINVLFIIQSPICRLREHGGETAVNAFNEEATYWVHDGRSEPKVNIFTKHIMVRDATDRE